MILSEDHHLIHHHQMKLDMITEEITEEDHRLDHPQEYIKICRETITTKE